MSSKIPRGTHVPADTKKTLSTAAHTAQKSDGVLKAQKENVQRKNVYPKVHKVVSTRYGQQMELKEQNQILMATNEELHKNLTDTQQRVSQLELQFGDLEKENVVLNKNLKDCHVLLVASKIDLVLGEKVGDAARQNEDQRKEIMSVSSDLLHEFKSFGDIASHQRDQLEGIQAAMTELANSREHMMQQRENFSQEAAELEKALQEAEALLL